MAWPPIDYLVVGSGQRAWLKEYGWWDHLVLDEFAFLDRLGYSLPRDKVKGVHFHFRGHYVWFQGPSRDVTIEIDPESFFTKAELWEDDGSTSGSFTDLDQALLRTGRSPMPPAATRGDRNAVEARVRWLASGLQANATDLLRLPIE